jgi:hypothetical protein
VQTLKAGEKRMIGARFFGLILNCTAATTVATGVAAQNAAKEPGEVSPIDVPMPPIGMMPTENPCNYVLVAPGFMCVPGLLGGYTIVALQGFSDIPPAASAPGASTFQMLTAPGLRSMVGEQPVLVLRPKNACDDITGIEEGYGCALRPDGSALIVPMNPSVPWKLEQ